MNGRTGQTTRDRYKRVLPVVAPPPHMVRTGRAAARMAAVNRSPDGTPLGMDRMRGEDRAALALPELGDLWLSDGRPVGGDAAASEDSEARGAGMAYVRETMAGVAIQGMYILHYLARPGVCAVPGEAGVDVPVDLVDAVVVTPTDVVDVLVRAMWMTHSPSPSHEREKVQYALVLMMRLIAERGVRVTPATSFVVFVGCYTIAGKMLEDRPFTNLYQARRFQTTCARLNRCEQWLLRALKFEVTVSATELATYSAGFDEIYVREFVKAYTDV